MQQVPREYPVQHLVDCCCGCYRPSLHLGVSRANGLGQFYQAQKLGLEDQVLLLDEILVHALP